MKADVVYKELLERILEDGVQKSDRTGTGTQSLFGERVQFDLREGFPLLTTKKMAMRSIIHELLWFLNGDTNIKYLVDNKVSIWDEWAYERYVKYCSVLEEPDVEILAEDIEQSRMRILTQKEFIDAIREDYTLELWQGKPTFSKIFGDLGPIYGFQWRNFGETSDRNVFGNSNISGYGVDQVTKVLQTLKSKPDDRRMIVTAWDPSVVDLQALPPCHLFWQVYTEEMSLFERKKIWCNSISKSIYYAEDLGHAELDLAGVPRRYISLQWYQRSVDTFLGLPFNIASYALLLQMIGQQVNMVPKHLKGALGDTHIYSNHVKQVKEQLRNDPFRYSSPTMTINKAKDLFSYKIEDFNLEKYESFQKISAPVAV